MSDKKVLIDFMESIRDYVRESGTNIAHDERESSEFVDVFLAKAQPKRKPIDGVLPLTKEELDEFSKIIGDSDKIKKVRLDSVGGIEYILKGGSMWLCVYEVKAILYLTNLFDLTEG